MGDGRGVRRAVVNCANATRGLSAIAEFLVELALRASVSYINPVMLIYFLVPACLSISPSLWDYKMN